ncbi:MAG: histone deacetylase, partial [Bacteroidota bacterium]
TTFVVPWGYIGAKVEIRHSMVKIFHSDRFVPALPEGHRFPIQKYGLIREQLLREGTVEAHQFAESDPCAESDILLVHTTEYWKAVKSLRLTPRQMRKIGFPQSATLVDRSRRSCQGTLAAALHALQHGIGLNIAGGTHHAFADAGEGFCLLNDLAITAGHLLKQQLASSILILDLDVHQGNGTARIFQGKEAVFTFSMHGAKNYPLLKEHSDLDVEMPVGTEDEAYLRELAKQLDHLKALQPDMVLYQAGIDVLATDRLGTLSLSREGAKTRDRMVLSRCQAWEVPVAVCMGGGYSRRLADTVEGHSNTFRVAAELYD